MKNVVGSVTNKYCGLQNMFPEAKHTNKHVECVHFSLTVCEFRIFNDLRKTSVSFGLPNNEVGVLPEQR